MVIGANPTDGHPVFASQMKRRLREGAKLIVADPRRIDLVRTPHVRPLSSAVAAGHERRDDQLARACDRDRRPGRTKISCAERCEPRAFEQWRDFVAEARNSPEAMEADHRRAGGRRARRRAPLCDRRQRRDLLRPGRDRTRARLDDGDGHRQSRDGDRQHRPRRRGRESAARTEQRAGFVRHGFVPARVPGLSPRSRRRRARVVRRSVGREAAIRTGPAHSEHVRRRARRRASTACISKARTSSSPIRTRNTSRRRCRRWNASSCRISS